MLRQIIKAFVMLLITTTLASCTGHSWSNFYGWDGRGNTWNEKQCSTHCRTFSDDGRRCIVYHENVQLYCNNWVKY